MIAELKIKIQNENKSTEFMLATKVKAVLILREQYLSFILGQLDEES